MNTSFVFIGFIGSLSLSKYARIPSISAGGMNGFPSTPRGRKVF
jgi:hypothetical protein